VYTVAAAAPAHRSSSEMSHTFAQARRPFNYVV